MRGKSSCNLAFGSKVRHVPGLFVTRNRECYLGVLAMVFLGLKEEMVSTHRCLEALALMAVFKRGCLHCLSLGA